MCTPTNTDHRKQRGRTAPERRTKKSLDKIEPGRIMLQVVAIIVLVVTILAIGAVIWFEGYDIDLLDDPIGPIPVAETAPPIIPYNQQNH